MVGKKSKKKRTDRTQKTSLGQKMGANGKPKEIVTGLKGS